MHGSPLIRTKEFEIKLETLTCSWGAGVVTEAGLQAFGFPGAAEVAPRPKAEC